jgi:low temperature requirement protein LtrA
MILDPSKHMNFCSSCTTTLNTSIQNQRLLYVILIVALLLMAAKLPIKFSASWINSAAVLFCLSFGIPSLFHGRDPNILGYFL